jgi:hypothetical protein
MARYDADKPKTLCLVKACLKKAIYRNPNTARTHSQLGYCFDHKALATAKSDRMESVAWYAERQVRYDP